ncbi:MAG: hypothetical protein OJF49_004031 [Ktedonobacterales bacterium]|jgi:hypothetical protein|nr:MAG: hypothetical protein OJF49_004031 [Ktedonobacterales bacterium]
MSILPTIADSVSTFDTIGTLARAFASIIAGLIAILGVPLALRQVVNLQRELRRYETESLRRIDAEANVNISARYSLTRPSHDQPYSSIAALPGHRPAHGEVSEQPSPAAEPGKRVLRLDLTLENVGEGTVDVLACLVAARELERQGEGVISAGRDAQWEDLTPHYWDCDPATCLSPGLSTTKHIVYAQDALARIKAKGHKTLARIDQLRERADDTYLLYRICIAVRRSSRSTDEVQAWAALQRALLNVNAPAFRTAAAEEDPLGYVSSADGWRLFLHHNAALADPKLSQLRREADREELALTDPAARTAAEERHATELRAYCEKTLLPGWRRFRRDYDRMAQASAGFVALLADRGFRQQQRRVERVFPWNSQEVWTEYFYVTLQDEA